MGVDGTWDEQVVKRIFWPVDAELILTIRPSARAEEDFLAWHPDKLGIFSVRSAYKLALQLAAIDNGSGSSEAEISKAWNLVWKCNVPQKVKVFTWRAATNSLATMENKNKRKLEASGTCGICGVEAEDVAHALCRCPQAKKLWDAMQVVGKGAKDIVGNCTGADWILDQLKIVPREEHAMFLMVLWRIWYVRNEITHGKNPPPVGVSKRFLESYISSLLEVRQCQSINLIKGKHIVQYSRMPKMKDPSASTPAILRWEKPNQGWMKLNVDGSFDASSGKGCIGAVLRNSQGEVIFSACGFLDHCSGPLEAELLACKEGINMALQWTLLPIVVELDCSVAVKLISSVSKGRSEVAFIVRDRSGVYRQRHQTVDVWEQGDYHQEDTP